MGLMPLPTFRYHFFVNKLEKSYIMKFDLNKICERNDYKRLTAKLKSVTEEVARTIHQKMDELEVDENSDFDNGEIGSDDVIVKVVNVCTYNGFSDSYLGIRRRDKENCSSYYANLEDIGHTYYFCGDYNSQIIGASNKEAIAFLNASAKLIKGLGDYEQYLINEINKTLNNID